MSDPKKDLADAVPRHAAGPDASPVTGLPVSAPAPRGSLWEATSAPPPATPPLVDTIDCDVLVIGAGIAGLSTALALAEAGTATVVLEADAIGAGATGQSGGLIAPDFIRHTPESIAEAIGREAGERLSRFVGGSAAAAFALAERLGIACDPQRGGFITPAHNEAAAHRQRDLAAQWASRGYPVRFIGPDEVRDALGTARYLGGVRFEEGGSLNPLALVRGLATAALARGARIHTASPVTALARHGEQWVATAPGGTVRARRVVLAANGGNARLHPALARTVLPLPVVEFATAPLDPALRKAIIPKAGGFTDKTPYVFTARYDGHGHLVSAFPGSWLIRGDAAIRREARRRLAWQYPALRDVEIRYLWPGTAWINPSLLPILSDLGDGAIAVQACNGRGLSTNLMLGQALGAWLAGTEGPDLPVLPVPPVAVRNHAFARLMPTVLMGIAQLGARFR